MEKSISFFVRFSAIFACKKVRFRAISAKNKVHFRAKPVTSRQIPELSKDIL